MSQSIEKVTLENAAEQLKAKIRTAFVELLPEEQWKEMVAAELRRFTQAMASRDSYGRETTAPSDFSAICREVFQQHTKDALKELLNSSEWQSRWGSDGREAISAAIKQWCTENRQALIEATVLSMAGTAAQHVINNMRHG